MPDGKKGTGIVGGLRDGSDISQDLVKTKRDLVFGDFDSDQLTLSEAQTVAVNADGVVTSESSHTLNFDAVDLGDPKKSPDTLVNDLLRSGKARIVSLGEIGRGGMGSIEAVVDLPLRRRLAMKIVHGSQASTWGERLPQFVREARINAQLEHRPFQFQWRLPANRKSAPRERPSLRLLQPKVDALAETHLAS